MRGFRANRDDVVDLGLAALGVGLGYVTFVPSNPVGEAVAGPPAFAAVFPLLLAGPLAWRRRAPLRAFTVMVAAIVFQALLTTDSPEGLQMIFALGVGAYSVAAYASRRRALGGLGLAVFGYLVYAAANTDVRTGEAGQLWAASFFAVALVAAWLAGFAVSSRRQGRLQAARAKAAEEDAERAVTVERARLARELHDVVSHHLSVVVLQAAGARSTNPDNAATLEKIETSGRESLVEMRRLLGVLRSDGGTSDLTPQPGFADLDDLTRHVGEAGLRVELATEGPTGDLGAALGLSVYRIVQEALTNVIRHAEATKALVRVVIGDEQVTVEVTDDGRRLDAGGPRGHGLVGMRERAALFGGTFDAGRMDGGGYRVRVVFPIGVAG